MGNLGAAVSRKGYDVKNSADRLKIFSSSFQNLKIYNAYTVSTTVPAADINTITINHNLGYYAPHIVIYNGSSSIGTGTSYFMSDSSGYHFTEYYGIIKNYQNSLTIEVNEFFDDVGGTVVGDTVYFTVYVFLDDFSTISETNINDTENSLSSGDKWGIRVSKENFDVKTCSDLDCIMSSSFPTKVVDKKGSSVSNGSAVTITHGLGYVPLAWAFVRDSGGDFIRYQNPTLSSTNIVVSYKDAFGGLSAGDTIYYIIFKNRLV